MDSQSRTLLFGFRFAVEINCSANLLVSVVIGSIILSVTTVLKISMGGASIESLAPAEIPDTAVNCISFGGIIVIFYTFIHIPGPVDDGGLLASLSDSMSTSAVSSTVNVARWRLQ